MKCRVCALESVFFYFKVEPKPKKTPDECGANFSVVQDDGCDTQAVVALPNKMFSWKFKIKYRTHSSEQFKFLCFQVTVMLSLKQICTHFCINPSSLCQTEARK